MTEHTKHPLSELNAMNKRELQDIYEEEHGLPAGTMAHQSYNTFVAALHHGKRIKHLTEEDEKSIMATGGGVGELKSVDFYKEGSDKWGLGYTEIFIKEEGNEFVVYDNVFDENSDKWEIKKIGEFEKFDNATEFALDYARKNKMATGGKVGKQKEQEIEFVSEGKMMKAMAKRYNDAFYEITEGADKGSLVHVYDVVGEKFADGGEMKSSSFGGFFAKFGALFGGSYFHAEKFCCGGKMANGGAIKNQYAGKTAKQVWGAWNEKQRAHFLLDHSELLDNDRDENNLGYSRIVQKDKSYVELTPHTKRVLEAHVESGQYKHGGSVGNEKWIKGALSHGKKGTLKRKAVRRGLISNTGERLSIKDLHELERVGGKTAKEAHLAETLRKFGDGGLLGDGIENEIANGYLSAVLFTESDDDEEPLDSNYDVNDFDKKTKSTVMKMVKEYISDNKDAIEKSGLKNFVIGNDIWYTQSGQGAGFFDHSLDDDVEKKLSDGAKKFGDLSVNAFAQDGKVYVEGIKI